MLPVLLAAWIHLSSATGDLPSPGGSHQQTGVVTGRFDKGKAEGFVIAHRVKAPALVWFRRAGKTWERYVIEPQFLTLEAGGAVHDIDRDGDEDIVFGEDWQGANVYWWENPFPNFDPAKPWRRHNIKTGGAKQHHDQIFADLFGAGEPQLIFWNQSAKALYAAALPEKGRPPVWKLETVYQGKAGEGESGAAAYAEGLDAADIDGDGRTDLLAGNHWFRNTRPGKQMAVQPGQFVVTKVAPTGGRIRAGRFRQGKVPQIVIAPGDGSGPLRLYTCDGEPTRSDCWQGRDLLPRPMIHGHTLEVGDIDGDGNLDIFAAEMAKWTDKPEPDNPGAIAWILYGNGKGEFRIEELVRGHDWHEGRLADLDGDGDLDVLNKPYTWNAPRVDVWLNQ